MPQPDENGFVKRGFLLLGIMALLVGAVLSIIFYKPNQTQPIDAKDLPANASEPGWKIRANATITLLRRGSDQVSWRVVREMLDEKQQLKNSEFKLKDGRTVADEHQARSFVITALKALAEWKRKTIEGGKNNVDEPALAEIRTQVDLLTQSPIPELKRQAEETKLVLAK